MYRGIDAVAELMPQVVVKGRETSGRQNRHEVFSRQTQGVPRHT